MRDPVAAPMRPAPLAADPIPDTLRAARVALMPTAAAAALAWTVDLPILVCLGLASIVHGWAWTLLVNVTIPEEQALEEATRR